MNNERIEIGDIVHVDCNNGHTTIMHKGLILYKPCATGDSWIFKDLMDNRIIYVSEGITIILLEKKAEE